MRNMEMSIKKQSIVLLAGFAALAAMSSASAFKGAVAGAPKVAVERAAAEVSLMAKKSGAFSVCANAGTDARGNKLVQMNTSALGVPTAPVAYNPDLDADALELIGLAGNCAAPAESAN